MVGFINSSYQDDDNIQVLNINSSGTLDALLKVKRYISERFIYLHGNIIYNRELIHQIINRYENNNCICLSKSVIAPTHAFLKLLQSNIIDIRYSNNDIGEHWYCSMGVAMINKRMLNVNHVLDNDTMMEAIIIPSIEKGIMIETHIYEDRWFHLQTQKDLLYIGTNLNKSELGY